MEKTIKKILSPITESKMPKLEKQLEKFRKDNSVNILVEWLNFLEELRITRHYFIFTYYLVATVIAGPIVLPIIYILSKLGKAMRSIHF